MLFKSVIYNMLIKNCQSTYKVEINNDFLFRDEHAKSVFLRKEEIHQIQKD